MTIIDDEGNDNDDEGDGDDGDDRGDDGHKSCTHDDHSVMTTTMWPQWTMHDGDNNVATKDDNNDMATTNNGR